MSAEKSGSTWGRTGEVGAGEVGLFVIGMRFRWTISREIEISTANRQSHHVYVIIGAGTFPEMSGFGNLDCGLPATSRELVFMRHIGELNDDSQALVFAAYLKVQGIESQIDPQSGGGAEIWIKDEDQFDDARRELKSFQDDPSNSKYSESVQIAKTLVRDEEKKRKQLQKKIIRVGAGNVKRKPPLTLTLIGLCVLVALITNFGQLQ